jgi:DNA-binding GntR family transcriptional regulator
MVLPAVFITKSEFVHNYLKEKILVGELSMGESLNITQIAKDLLLSTIPVREAIQRLETEGLIDIIPHKGAQVRSFDPEKIKEIFSIRAVLEGLAAKTAIPNLNSEKINHLKQMTEEMKQCAQDNDDEKFGVLNKEFHRFIYEHSTPLMFDMIFNLWTGNWSKAIFAFKPNRMQEAVVEHLEIIQAIEDKDEELTEQLVKQHKLNTSILFESALKNNAIRQNI